MRMMLAGAIVLSLVTVGAMAGERKPVAATSGCTLDLRADMGSSMALSVVVTTMKSFADAYHDLCAQKKVKPGLFAEFVAVKLVDAAGATEPHLYTTGTKPRRALTLEYVFDGGRSPAPSKKDMSDAILCYVKPTEECQGD